MVRGVKKQWRKILKGWPSSINPQLGPFHYSLVLAYQRPTSNIRVVDFIGFIIAYTRRFHSQFSDVMSPTRLTTSTTRSLKALSTRTHSLLYPRLGVLASVPLAEHHWHHNSTNRVVSTLLLLLLILFCIYVWLRYKGSWETELRTNTCRIFSNCCPTSILYIQAYTYIRTTNITLDFLWD